MKGQTVTLGIISCVALAVGFAIAGPGMQGKGSDQVAAKGKPAPAPGPTSMYFSNRPGDKITNDSWGPYVDGVGGVVCKVYQTTGTDCNFLLNITTTSKPKRSVNYSFTDPTADGETTCGGGEDTGNISSAGWLAVHHVGDAPIGVPGSRLANFYAGSYFKFAANENCAVAVVLIRLDAQHWRINTDQTYGTSLLNALGNLHPVGDIAERILYPSADFAGNYHMPFEMNIDCPSCK